jgi:DNA integrity scanning protein DisA with diadenylate cyclase activity
MDRNLDKLKTVEKKALEIAVSIARDKKGGLIAIGNLDDSSYSTHFPNLFANKKHTIFEKGMLETLRHLGEIDGALIISKDGKIIAYGARLLPQKTFPGKGTRHAAAFGISEKATAILISEEENNIKIFKNGKLLMQINPHNKNIETNLSKIIDILNNPSISVIAGSLLAAPLLNVTVLPGVVVFTGSYYLANNLIKMLKKN